MTNAADQKNTLVLRPGPHNAMTDVPGIEVGHFTHDAVMRGVTAILCRDGAVAGVSVRGSNPGTFNTDALAPTAAGQIVHGIGLTGGSLFGLATLSGITDYLSEQGVGFQYSGTALPVVAGAVIFDLLFADATVRPQTEWGYLAAEAATTENFARGNTGAGAGATAGKGPGCIRTKGGLGSASLQLPDGIVVGAIIVINAMGSLIHPLTGELYAVSGGFDTPLLYQDGSTASEETRARTNTTIGAVATNAPLTKAQATKVADLAHDGLARAIRPAHAMLDGDAIFALSTSQEALNGVERGYAFVDMIGHAAADAMVLAALDAASHITAVGEWSSVAEAQAKIRD